MATTMSYQGDTAERAVAEVQAEAKPVPRSGFMVSPLYDGILFIGAPLIGLAIALATLGGLPWVMRPATVFGSKEAWISLFIGVWTYAHLCAVVFRSHLNREIYSRFRLRFTVVPLVLFLGLGFSDWLMVSAIILAVFWDVYHTAMQNFGFCRLYDSRQGIFSEKGRKLDILVNQILYVGPIVGGLSFGPTLKAFEQYADVGWYFPAKAAQFLLFLQPRLTVLFIVGGTLFLAYYVYFYWRLSQEGYRVSRQKVTILFSTGITSVWAWGFLPPFYAFFVSNFYHALQYFGIVWAMEKRNIRRTIRLSKRPGGGTITFALFVLSLVASGVAFDVYGTNAFRWGLAFFTVISLMHFWYDSFVWQAHKMQSA